MVRLKELVRIRCNFMCKLPAPSSKSSDRIKTEPAEIIAVIADKAAPSHPLSETLNKQHPNRQLTSVNGPLLSIQLHLFK